MGVALQANQSAKVLRAPPTCSRHRGTVERTGSPHPVDHGGEVGDSVGHPIWSYGMGMTDFNRPAPHR